MYSIMTRRPPVRPESRDVLRAAPGECLADPAALEVRVGVAVELAHERASIGVTELPGNSFGGQLELVETRRARHAAEIALIERVTSNLRGGGPKVRISLNPSSARSDQPSCAPLAR
jgi:hypothetical protein